MNTDLIEGASNAAAFTGLSRRKIYRMAEQGHVPVRRILANEPHQLQAACARHPKLRQHEVDGKPVQFGHGALGTIGQCDLEAGIGDAPGEHAEIFPVRLDDQYPPQPAGRCIL